MFRELKNNEIETKRLLLKRFCERDIDAFAEIVGQHEVGEQLPKGRGYTRSEAQKWLNKIIKSWKEDGFGTWALMDKETNKMLGNCGLNRIESLGETEVLYLLDKEAWGKGYATEAAYATLIYGFERLKLDKIIGLTKINNHKSANVLTKIGLSYQKNIEIFKMHCKYFELYRSDFQLKDSWGHDE